MLRTMNAMPQPSSLVSELIRFPRSPNDFRVHVVSVRVDDSIESELSESVARCVASGVSENPDIALAAAIGESWERIAFVNTIDLLRKSETTTFPRSLDPLLFKQLPFLLDRATDRSQWERQAVAARVRLRSYELHSAGGREKQTVLPVDVMVPNMRASLFETTNGLACAENVDIALDRAVCEIVERDALMLVWLTRSGGRRISHKGLLSADLCEQISRMAELQIKTTFRDISTPLGFKVFLVSISSDFNGKRFGLAFGAGANSSAKKAARHAFLEACLSWRGVSWRTTSGDTSDLNGRPTSFAGHAEFYSNWDQMHRLDFLIENESLEASQHEYEFCDEDLSSERDSGHVELLVQQGLDVLSTDITPHEAAASGLRIVQAVVPGLVPLYIGDRTADSLATARLPTSIGGIKVPIQSALNSNVHPWP